MLPAYPRHSRTIRIALCSAAALVLGACASSTQIVRNDHLSADSKGHKYHEILLIPPKTDPRNVVPRLVAALEAGGVKVRLIDPEKPLDAPQGTGFVISGEGHLITCAHVLGTETTATVTLEGKRIIADVVKADKDADLALLKLRDPMPDSATILSFRGASHGYAMGEDAFTIGFPMSRLLGNNARMSKGVVSATAGMKDDPKQIQISAEIQPGNSGGPVLDRDGQVIGVIQQTINPWRVVQSTGGALPQNVNFSVKNDPVVEFIKGASESVYGAMLTDHGGSLEKSGHAVAKIQAGIVATDVDTRDKVVARLGYISMWDIWYRFRLFVLSAFDYDTQEPLFAAGQGRDNLVSNEDVVIKDTAAQFLKGLESN